MNALFDFLLGPVVFPVIFLVVVGLPFIVLDAYSHRHDPPPPASWYRERHDDWS